MSSKPIVRDAPTWLPAAPTDADVFAIKAMDAGNASQAQQQRAMRFIVHGICGFGNSDFHPGATPEGKRVDGERISAFLQGRRDVARQIVKILQRPLKVGLDIDQHGPPPPAPAEAGESAATGPQPTE